MAKKKKVEHQMTSNDISKIQIIATMRDDSHIIAFSEDPMLIKIIVSYCKFAKLNDTLFGQVSLKEIME